MVTLATDDIILFIKIINKYILKMKKALSEFLHYLFMYFYIYVFIKSFLYGCIYLFMHIFFCLFQDLCFLYFYISLLIVWKLGVPTYSVSKAGVISWSFWASESRLEWKFEQSCSVRA